MPTLRETIEQWAEDNEVVLIFFDPADHFDHAIVGIVHGAGQEPAVVYDQAKVLAAMRADMASDAPEDEDVADDWFTFNTLGSFLGDHTPRFVIRPWEGDTDVETS